MTLSCYIPLYIYPNWWVGPIYQWTPIINAIANNPTLQFKIVLNINNGPGTTLNTDYVQGISNLVAAGTAGNNLKILGYVFTSYGARPIADVKQDIDGWKNLYNPAITGILLDEMASLTGSESYYSDITAYAKGTAGMTEVWGNPGNPTIQSYINTVDTTIIFEGGIQPSLATLAASTFYPLYNKSKFALNIFAQGSLDTAYIQALDAAGYIGHLHYTDDVLPNPYDVLPSYLNSLVSTLVSLPPDPAPPATQTYWYVTNRSPTGDFTQPIEDMVRSYLYTNWATAMPILPGKSTNPPTDFKSKVRFGDFEYDYFSTYYIRVKEEDTSFNNDLIINGGCFLMKTALNIDLTVRRLTYGEHFAEMNNMRLEVIRILGNYRPDQISGIHSIEVETPGERDIETRNFERAGRLQKTIWYLRIKAVCNYIKAYSCTIP